MARSTMAVKTPKICGNCNEEFTGTKCPECGSTKDISELAPDGLPKDMHLNTLKPLTRGQLKPVDDARDEEYMMNSERARSQHVDMQDNIREAYLIKSELRRLELESLLRERRDELTPRHVPQREQAPPEPQPMQMQNPFQPNTMNPQAQFMNQFMKMDVEDRTEFLEQLADANPAALSTLSGFFTQQQQMMPQQMPMNPYMQQPMNPYQQFTPPWMQQQPEQHAPPRDPTESAINMMDKLQEMSERSRHSEPSETATMIAALREELKAMNERIVSIGAERRNNENEALMQRIGQLEGHLQNPRVDGGIQEQIRNMKEMVTDLQDIGFMQRPESKNSVDEQIQLSKAKHEIDVDNREYALRELEQQAQIADKDMRSSLVTGLFKRKLGKPKNIDDETEPPASGQQATRARAGDKHISCDLPKPTQIVDVWSSDAGTVREVIPQKSEYSEE